MYLTVKDVLQGDFASLPYIPMSAVVEKNPYEENRDSSSHE